MTIQPQTLDLELAPEDNARLANLCGPLEQHLRHIERKLGIEINNRGMSFRLIGEEAAVRVGDELLRSLYADTANQVLTPESIHLTLRELDAEELTAPAADRLPELAIRTKRGLVKARTPNQQEYLRAIARHDINFGVGSGGHRQDLSGGRLRRRGPGSGPGSPAAPGAPRGGGRRAPGIPARTIWRKKSIPICAPSTTPCSRCWVSKRCTRSWSAMSSRSRPWPTCAAAP